MGSNGWKSGYDPVQRWLRVLTTVVCLGVFVYLAVIRQRTGLDDLPVASLALGSVMLLLGYEGLTKLPFREKSKDDDD